MWNVSSNLCVLAIAIMLTTNTFAEPPGGGGGSGGSGGNSGGGERGGAGGPSAEELADMQACNSKFESDFDGFGENMSNNRKHWAFRVFNEKKKFATKMIPAMATMTMCRLNLELGKSWDGVTIPYSVSKTFMKGRSSSATDSITVVISVSDAKLAAEGWSDYDRLYEVTVNDTKVVQVAVSGDASESAGEKTKGMMILKNMRAAFEGAGEKEEHTIIWSRMGDVTEDTDEADESGAVRTGFSEIKIMSKVTVQKNGAASFSQAGDGGWGSFAIDAEYRVNSDGKFTLKVVDVQGTNAFKLIADGDENGEGKLVVTHANDSSGGSKDNTDKRLGSDVQAFNVDFKEQTITSEITNMNTMKSAGRFQFRSSPDDMNKALRGESGGKSDHFSSDSGNAQFTRNPKEAFRK